MVNSYVKNDLPEVFKRIGQSIQGSVQIRVSPDALLEKSSSVGAILGRVRGEFDEMTQAVQRTNAYWNGEAAELFRKLFQDMKPHREEMFERLHEHVKDLGEIAQIYMNVEERVTGVNTALPKDAIE